MTCAMDKLCKRKDTFLNKSVQMDWVLDIWVEEFE
jgi:hypothetical protein